MKHPTTLIDYYSIGHIGKHQSPSQRSGDSRNPKINQRSTCIPRSLSDLYKWQDMKQTKQQMLRKYFEMVTDARQEPFIYTNDVSNEILKHTRQHNMPIETILHQKGQERNDRLKLKEHEMYGRDNVPKITRRAHNLQRDQLVFDRLYGLMNKTPEKVECTKMPKSLSEVHTKAFRQPVSPVLKPAPKSQPMGIRLLEKFKSAHQKEEPQQSMPTNVMNRQQTLSEKIRLHMSGEHSDAKSSQPKVKECFFSLVPLQQEIKQHHRQDTQSTVKGKNGSHKPLSLWIKENEQSQPKIASRKSTKSSDSRRSFISGEKENNKDYNKKTQYGFKFHPSSKKQEVAAQGQNRLNKVYKYILEKE